MWIHKYELEHMISQYYSESWSWIHDHNIIIHDHEFIFEFVLWYVYDFSIKNSYATFHDSDLRIQIWNNVYEEYCEIIPEIMGACNEFIYRRSAMISLYSS